MNLSAAVSAFRLSVLEISEIIIDFIIGIAN